jgi:hypothetical protein
MVAHNIREIYSLNKTFGDIGIEIEMEGDKPFPEGDVSDAINWRAETDGSLRGYSKEYVINNPITINQVSSHLNNLRALLKLSGCKIIYSFRAGVHVHINVQELTVNQMATFACLYWCLEKALVKYCGSQREGNHFCLRAEDAEYSVYLLGEAISKNMAFLDTDNIRYASMNLRAMPRYGSIEFRAMETQPDLSKIESWCKMLYRLREEAVKIDERRSIAYDISFKGPDRWANDILGEELFSLINYEGIDKDIIRGMRICQTIMYMEV